MGSRESSEILKDSKYTDQNTVFGLRLLTHFNISVIIETSQFIGIRKKIANGC